ASVGRNRESVCRALRHGKSGVRSLAGLEAIPDGLLIGATVDLEPEIPGQLKVISLAHTAAAEALDDARVDLDQLDLTRFGSDVSAHMGDASYLPIDRNLEPYMPRGDIPWWQQWLPNTACSDVANRYGLQG